MLFVLHWLQLRKLSVQENSQKIVAYILKIIQYFYLQWRSVSVKISGYEGIKNLRTLFLRTIENSFPQDTQIHYSCLDWPVSDVTVEVCLWKEHYRKCHKSLAFL